MAVGHDGDFFCSSVSWERRSVIWRCRPTTAVPTKKKHIGKLHKNTMGNSPVDSLRFTNMIASWAPRVMRDRPAQNQNGTQGEMAERFDSLSMDYSPFVN